MTGRLTIDTVTGHLTGPAVITYNSPWPCRNGSWGSGAMSGVVMHTMAGNLPGTVSWFNSSQAQASAHFGIGQSGAIHQFGPVGKGWVAWAQGAGNKAWYSVEHADDGNPANPLTLAQITASAQITECLSAFAGFPLQITDDPVNGHGLITHGDGGEAWGGHYNCLMLRCTEVLTPVGWLPLRDVTMDTELASYATDTGFLTFARPLGIVPPHVADTVRVSDFEMTPDHRLFVFRSDHPTRKFIEAGDLEGKRTNWLVPHSGMLDTEGLGIGGDLMRFLVWVQADGHYQVKDGRVEAVNFHLTKERKVQRIREVLGLLDKDYTLSRRANGTTVIRVYGMEWLQQNVFRHLDGKMWPRDLYRADAYEFAALDEEITQADGTESGGQRFYFSTPEQNADAIQALYVTHGRAATIYRGHVGGADRYTVNLHAPRAGRTLRDRFEPGHKQVEVGCVTTQDGTILIRQNGRVMVVGNCPGDVRKAQRPQILALAMSIRQEKSLTAVPASREWLTAGQSSLASLAMQEHCTPAEVLQLTAIHGAWPADVSAYVNGVFAGTISPSAPMPKGLALYLPA